jgi:polyvinyl alcohol dehydrogenase (cytochrome)
MPRALLIALTLAIVAGPLAASAQAAEQQAYAVGLTYATPAIVAGKGDTLRFNNLDPLAQHDLDSDQPGLFDSPLVATGASTDVRGVSALAPGTYAFHCSLHSWMKGALTVTTADGAPKPPQPGPSPKPPPAPDTPNPADLLPKAPADPLVGADWPFYGKDLSNSRDGGESGPSYNEVPNLGPVWSHRSSDGDFTGTPVVADGTLVAAAGGGTVYALDAQTGKVKWQRDLVAEADENGAAINGTAAIAGGRVYVPLAKVGDPRLVALNLADGSLLWNADLDDQKNSDVFGSPVVADGSVYIGTSAEFGEVNDPNVNTRGSVVALDAVTGERRWKTFTVPEGKDGGAVWNTPAIDTATHRLYAGTGNAYHAPAADTTDSILVFDANTGELLDHHQTTAGDVWNATGNATAGPDSDLGASPNLFESGGRKLVGEGAKSGIYWAFDRGTLDPTWKTQIGPGSQVGGIVGSTAVDSHGIYGSNTPAGEIWSLGLGGALRWASADGDPLHFSSVSVANGVVYSTDMAGNLNARDVTTGAVLAKLPLGAPSWGGVSIAGGSVFAVTGTQGTSGWIVAYRPRG